MEVEEYTYLKYFEMLSIVEEKSVTRIQGRPVVLVYSGQFTAPFLKDFFELTFPVLSKIVLQKEDKHYLLCDKYEKECIEPFIKLIDVTGETNNDILTLIDYITK